MALPLDKQPHDNLGFLANVQKKRNQPSEVGMTVQEYGGISYVIEQVMRDMDAEVVGEGYGETVKL